MIVLLAVLLLWAALCASANATVVVIGPGAGCDRNTLVLGDQDQVQAALNGGGTDIRLVTGVYRESIRVQVSTSINISGGYANCASARSGVPAHAELSVLELKVGAFSVLDFTPAPGAGAHDFYLTRLTLRPSVNHGPNPSTGIVQTGSRLYLVGSQIHGFNTRGMPGGGLFLYRGEARFVRSRIWGNTASSGGGVFCSTGNLYADELSSIDHNTATHVDSANPSLGGFGGGLTLSGGCVASIFGRASLSPRGHSEYRGLMNNTATRSGGGAYAEQSTLSLMGGPGCQPVGPECPNGPALSMLNTAGDTGGGIALVDSTAYLEFAGILQNTAGAGGGGGIHVSGAKSRLNIGVLYGGYAAAHARGSCLTPAGCNAIQGNTVSGAGSTGAGLKITGGALEANSLWVSYNQGGAAPQMHIGGDAYTQFEQLLMEGGDTGLAAVLVTEQASASFHGSLLWGAGPGIVLAGTLDAQLNIRRSGITHLLGGRALALANNATQSGMCNAYLGNWSGPAGSGINVGIDDIPLSYAAVDGALVDRCPGESSPLPYDITGQPRVSGSAIDIGPYEMTSSLFSDGFEASTP